MGANAVELSTWIPLTFLLGLAGLGLMFAFIRAVTKSERRLMILFAAIVTVFLFDLSVRGAAAPEWF